MKATLSVARFNAKGKLFEEIIQPSKSFVRAFIQILYVQHSFLSTATFDTGNTSRSATSGQNNLKASTPGGHASIDADAQVLKRGDLFGIQVGTGVLAPAPTDYKLTEITHGQAEGKLIFAGSEVEPPVIANPNVTMLLRRFFNNKSGGVVTVREVGLYVTASDGIIVFFFLVLRDVLEIAVDVANTELLRVQYTLQTTV